MTRGLARQGLDIPPWEPSSRFSGETLGAVAERQPVCDSHPSRGAVDAGSGLTRRGVVYEYIRRHPGTHVRGMANALGLATGALQYHLLWLERHGFVKTKRVGFYRLVFPTLVFGEEQELILGVLSQETPREVLLRLVDDPSASQGELSRGLGLSQPTISWHIDRLVELGVLWKAKTARGTICEVSVDRSEVLKLAESYHPEALRRLARSVEDPALLDMAGRGGVRLISPALVELIGKR